MDNHYIDSEPGLPSPSGGSKLIQSFGILLRLIGFIIVGGITANLVFSWVAGYSLESLRDLITDPQPSQKFALWSLQGVNQLFMFIVLPLVYLAFLNRGIYSRLFERHDKIGIYLLIAPFIILSSIPLINWLSQWNKMIDLPDFMDGMERWMQSKEYSAKKLTDAMAFYDTPAEFVVALLIIAIFPAIGEELLFRGIIQNEFSHVLKNPHAAIWITGFIFSFFHLQFFGFFPRMFLGVTFGYLYFWSGNIWVPILVHFINNGVTLIAYNLYKDKIINMDPDSVEGIPAYSIIISLVVFTFLMLTFKKTKSQTP